MSERFFRIKFYRKFSVHSRWWSTIVLYYSVVKFSMCTTVLLHFPRSTWQLSKTTFFSRITQRRGTSTGRHVGKTKTLLKRIVNPAKKKWKAYGPQIFHSQSLLYALGIMNAFYWICNGTLLQFHNEIPFRRITLAYTIDSRLKYSMGYEVEAGTLSYH